MTGYNAPPAVSRLLPEGRFGNRQNTRRSVMQTLKYKGGSVDLDDDGYLVNIGSWNETIAAALAKNEGIKRLTAEHVEVVKFLRNYYMKFNSFPLLRMVCTNLDRPADCMTKPFNMDPLKAWKIAGLPQPGEEALSYLAGPLHIGKAA